MLILNRKISERLTVGDNVVITVLAVRGNQVRLGVSASRDKTVYLEEISKRVKTESGGRFRPPKKRGANACLHR
ncbi:UNVERIFIED_CONTAM: hypothetical protein GTU68_027552 [Idotea baltica]|nr:hypothetical protein [Idotea baltica]